MTRTLARLYATLLCSLLIAPQAGWSQVAAPLPPAAQEALDKGIVAANLPDYLLAIRYFEEARKAAPDAPVIYFNLGLAESKIPSRELRAMAWFGAYLAAFPDAPNASVVKAEIGALEVRHHSNTAKFLAALLDAANQTAANRRDENLRSVVASTAASGDIVAARRIVQTIQDPIYAESGHFAIVRAQAESGDVLGARKSADSLSKGLTKDNAMVFVLEAHVRAGDMAGAQSALDLIRSADTKNRMLAIIAGAQARAGNIADAQRAAAMIESAGSRNKLRLAIVNAQADRGDLAAAKETIALIDSAYSQSYAHLELARAQAKSGDMAGAKASLATAQKIADLIPEESSKNAVQDYIRRFTQTFPAGQPPAQRWLLDLYNPEAGNYLALNTDIFLDFPGHLKSLPRSADPQAVFSALAKTAEIVTWTHILLRRRMREQLQ